MWISTTRQRVLIAVLGAAMLALLLPVGPTQIAEAQTTPLIEALNGPQGIHVDDDGVVWVIDAGLGGEEQIEIFDTSAGDMAEARLGDSARIVRFDPATGEAAEVALLPSMVTEMNAYGGARLLEHDGEMFASVGEWARPDVEAPTGMGTIMKIGANGATSMVADAWAHELANDPYPRGVSHSHPYGMAIGPDGRLLYADSGANALMAVDLASGDIETVVAFEPLPGVFPRPDYDGELLTDPVPTAVVVRDDRVFVSLLSGAPFAPGSAKVVEVHADGTVSEYANAMTMLTDLRLGPDDNLYATTFAVFGEEGPAPASGSVSRINADGSTEVVADGLSFVTSVDFDAEGNAYVATNGVGPPGSGAVVRIDGMATAGSQQLPLTGSAGTIGLVIAGVALLAAGAMLVRFRVS